ncbi:putative ribosomal protein S11 [Forsythia ovata]|uniref:Ribosomal protein S11 n=1 Tax=Forsythia ovata TaxID=205694 RepID=A0ABD1UE95_9LAMI
MIFRKCLSGPGIQARLSGPASRILRPGSDRPFHAFTQNAQNSHVYSENFKGNTHLESSIFGNLAVKLGLMKVQETVTPPYAAVFRSYIHSGQQTEVEAGRTYRSMDFVQGIIKENGNNMMGRPPISHFEQNADIVHVKLMRNNTFITVTDSKGNKKLGTSAGKLATKGGKVSRYSAEAAAEDIGRKAREMKLKSVVMKVNGFTYFKKKKQAVLSFREGYTHSRGDLNPVVYIEDTTRKPHNGCRLRKKRRV